MGDPKNFLLVLNLPEVIPNYGDRSHHIVVQRQLQHMSVELIN
jgi:hypothetical protein